METQIAADMMSNGDDMFEFDAPKTFANLFEMANSIDDGADKIFGELSLFDTEFGELGLIQNRYQHGRYTIFYNLHLNLYLMSYWRNPDLPQEFYVSGTL